MAATGHGNTNNHRRARLRQMHHHTGLTPAQENAREAIAVANFMSTGKTDPTGTEDRHLPKVTIPTAAQNMYHYWNASGNDGLSSLNTALDKLSISDVDRLPFYATAWRENQKGDRLADAHPQITPRGHHPKPIADTHPFGLMQVSYNTVRDTLKENARGARVPHTHPTQHKDSTLLAALRSFDEAPIADPASPAGRAAMKLRFDQLKGHLGIKPDKPFDAFHVTNDGKVIINPYQRAINYMEAVRDGRKPTKQDITAIHALLRDGTFNAMIGITYKQKLTHQYSAKRYAASGINPNVLADLAYISPTAADKVAAEAQAGRYNSDVGTLLRTDTPQGKALPADYVQDMLTGNRAALDGTVGSVVGNHNEVMNAFLPPKEAERRRQELTTRIQASPTTATAGGPLTSDFSAAFNSMPTPTGAGALGALKQQAAAGAAASPPVTPAKSVTTGKGPTNLLSDIYNAPSN